MSRILGEWGDNCWVGPVPTVESGTPVTEVVSSVDGTVICLEGGRLRGMLGHSSVSEFVSPVAEPVLNRCQARVISFRNADYARLSPSDS